MDLQALDTRTAQLRHRRSALPQRAELAALQTRLGQLRDLLVAAETAEGDLDRELRKAESDVEQVRTRAARDQQRLDSGAVSTPRELENLQHEIASLAKRQGDLEDVVLEVMERQEAAQERTRTLRAQREETESKQGEAETAVAQAEGEIDAELAKALAERQVFAGEIPADLLALYEKLREQYDGIGAAALKRRRCEGCRLELDISELNAVRAAAPDEVIRHDACRRILVRTPESGL